MNPELPHPWSHNHSSAEELAADRSFQAWVYGSDEPACAFWDNWLSTRPEKAVVVEEARALVRQLSFREYGHRAELEEVGARLEHLMGEKRRTRVLRWGGAAAAATVLFICGWFVLRHPAREARPIAGTTGQRPGAMEDSARVAITSWQTAINRSARPKPVRLPDGSVAMLFHGSAIRYPPIFPAGERTVRIAGDVQFDIARETGRRFTVYSRQLTVAVLGTSFRITTWESKRPGTRVKLFSGKIRVFRMDGHRAGTEGVLLHPGEQADFDGSSMAVSKFIRNDIKTPSTNFSNTPLADVLKTLSALYRLPIAYNLADVAERRFTGNIDKADQPQAVLSAIAKINGLTVVRTTGGFYLTRTANQTSHNQKN
ncbi:MAG TPA: FecR domain-containing protein [Puia sp.]|nr:FecR domain-containing protein [Puia sp.]